MRNKKEERAPILYEKYKQANEKKQEIYVLEKPRESGKSFGKRIGDLLIILILLGMVGLAAIGMTTLLNPEMRLLLIDFIGR